MIKAYEICLQMLEQRNYSILDRDDERILAQKPNNEPMCVCAPCMRVFLLFGFVYLFCRFLLLRFYVHLGSMPYAQLHSDHVIELIQIWAIKKKSTLRLMIQALVILKKSQTRPPALSRARCFHFTSLSNAPCSMFPALCSQLPFPALSSLLSAPSYLLSALMSLIS